MLFAERKALKERQVVSARDEYVAERLHHDKRDKGDRLARL